jgi:hypothetical protein
LQQIAACGINGNECIPAKAIPCKAEAVIGLIVRNQGFCFGGTEEEAESGIILNVDEDLDKS